MNIVEPSFGAFAIGSLAPLSEFETKTFRSRQLPPSFPVLTCTVDRREMQLVKVPRAQGCFGYGNMTVVRPGTNNLHRVLTIRLQLGCNQVYWIADITDAEVWKAIDVWKKRGRVAVAFLQGDECALTVADCKKGKLDIEQFRTGEMPLVPKEFIDIAGTIADGGALRMQASTDIPGILLENVIANVLLSSRLRKFIDHEPIAERPVIATQGSAGAGLIH
jgi:hypothetical protein